MKILLFILLSITASGQVGPMIMSSHGNSTTTPPVTGDLYVSKSGNDANPCSLSQRCLTIQHALDVATTGQTIVVGTTGQTETYRESPTVGDNGITVTNASGATVIVSGLNEAGNTGWSVYSGNIYQKTITLPNSSQFTEYTGGSNTVLLANQVFKDGVMMMQARWPNISTPEDQLDKTQMRLLSNTSAWSATSLTDAGLPSGLSGGYISMQGWFLTQTRQIASHTTNTINYTSVISVNGEKFRKFYYVTGKLGLLDAEKEWHYESGVLYFRQVGGGSPTGVEYKARNWGFDVRNRTGFTVRGINFIGVDALIGNSASTNTTIDRIDSQYPNFNFLSTDAGSDYTRAAEQVGIKLLGANSQIIHSRIAYASDMGVWMGPNCRGEDNIMHDMIWSGLWGSCFKPWGSDDGMIVTKNTMYRIGRGAIELHAGGAATLNMDLSYNHMWDFYKNSIDGGPIYSGLNTDLTGTNIHHNWSHSPGIVTTGGIDGVQVTGPVYLDQGAGPVNAYKNITWDDYECDYYAEIKNYARDNGGSRLYNNTFAGTDRNYITYAIPAAADIQRNNIYRGDLVSPNFPLDVSNSVMKTTNPLFLGTGSEGLVYRLQSGSPARNIGAILPPYTNGYEGVAPDAGGYEFGEDWVAGCSLLTNPYCSY